MYFGYGMVHCKSSKQKLNTKSSIEVEVVGISDYLPYHIWIFLFMRAQRYNIKQNILFHDNQSTIKMEKNRKKLCIGNFRHIDIRYLFAKGGVENNKISIPYCNTLPGRGWSHLKGIYVFPPHYHVTKFHQ